MKEIQDIFEDLCIRYPQLELYLKSKHMSDIADLIRDAKGGDVEKGSMQLDIDELKIALAHVDSQVKSLPATAQVTLITSKLVPNNFG